MAVVETLQAFDAAEDGGDVVGATGVVGGTDQSLAGVVEIADDGDILSMAGAPSIAGLAERASAHDVEQHESEVHDRGRRDDGDANRDALHGPPPRDRRNRRLGLRNRP